MHARGSFTKSYNIIKFSIIYINSLSLSIYDGWTRHRLRTGMGENWARTWHALGIDGHELGTKWAWAWIGHEMGTGMGMGRIGHGLGMGRIGHGLGTGTGELGTGTGELAHARTKHRLGTHWARRARLGTGLSTRWAWARASWAGHGTGGLGTNWARARASWAGHGTGGLGTNWARTGHRHERDWAQD
jgi:hypothetical protein